MNEFSVVAGKVVKSHFDKFFEESSSLYTNTKRKKETEERERGKQERQGHRASKTNREGEKER